MAETCHCACVLDERSNVKTTCGAHYRYTSDYADERELRVRRELEEQIAEIEAERDEALMALARHVIASER